MMKKFEYKTIKVDTCLSVNDIDKILDSFGKEGWELVVAATDNNADGDGDTYTESIWYTFKREIE